MKRLSFFAFVLLCCMSGLAQVMFTLPNDDGKNIPYKVFENDPTLGAYVSRNIYEQFLQLDGDIIVPEQITYHGQTYTVKEVSRYGLSNSTGITSIVLPESVTTIQLGGLSHNPALTNVVFPKNIHTIPKECLCFCPSLKTFTVPDHITTIAQSVFQHSGLESIDFGNCLQVLGERALQECVGLKELDFPDTFTSLYDQALLDCSGLETVRFGSSFAFVGFDAFGGCTGIKDFYCGAVTPPQVYDHKVFFSIQKSTCVLHVPEQSVEAYSSATGWSKFKNIKGDYASVDDVVIDDNADAPVEYYDLRGVRVDNPTSGLYIRRQGSHVEKVMLR